MWQIYMSYENHQAIMVRYDPMRQMYMSYTPPSYNRLGMALYGVAILPMYMRLIKALRFPHCTLDVAFRFHGWFSHLFTIVVFHILFMPYIPGYFFLLMSLLPEALHSYFRSTQRSPIEGFRVQQIIWLALLLPKLLSQRPRPYPDHMLDVTFLKACRLGLYV